MTGRLARAAAALLLLATLAPAAAPFATATASAAAPSPSAKSSRPAPRVSFTKIEYEVMCVTCRVPLALAESPQADSERAYIRSLIRKGKTEAQIKRALVAQYGPTVLAVPPKHGFTLAAWLVPIVVVLAGLIGILIALPRLRRARARRAADEPPDDELSEPGLDGGHAITEAERTRLERELARFH